MRTTKEILLERQAFLMAKLKVGGATNASTEERADFRDAMRTRIAEINVLLGLIERNDEAQV